MSITAFPKHRRLNNLEISTLPGVQVSIIGSQTAFPTAIGTASIAYIRSDAAGGLVEISGLSSGSLTLEDRGAASGNRRFTITKNDDNTVMRAFNDAGTAATQNFIDMEHSNGFVGIGATTPLDKLHVSNNIRLDGTKIRVAGSLLEFETNGTVLRADLTSTGRFRVIGSGTTVSSLPGILFRNSSNAVDAQGLWQLVLEGTTSTGGIELYRNTAVAGDFSTTDRFLKIRGNGNTFIMGVPSAGAFGVPTFNVSLGIGMDVATIAGLGVNSPIGQPAAAFNRNDSTNNTSTGSLRVLNNLTTGIVAASFGNFIQVGVLQGGGALSGPDNVKLAYVVNTADGSGNPTLSSFVLDYGNGLGFTSNQFVFTSGGQLRIGDGTLPAEELDVAGDVIATGHVSFGNNAAVSTDFVQLVAETFTTASASFGSHGIRVIVDHTGASGTLVDPVAISAVTTFSGAGTGTAGDNLVGLLVQANVNSPRNLSAGDFRALDVRTSSLVGQVGTVADCKSIIIQAPDFAAGSKPTDNFGLDIENQGAAGITTARAIRIQAQSGSTTNRGLVSITTNNFMTGLRLGGAEANPGAFVLDAQGAVNITGKLTVGGAIDPTQLLLSGGTKKIGATDTGTIFLAPFADSTTAIQIRKADDTTDVMNIDTVNSRVSLMGTENTIVIGGSTLGAAFLAHLEGTDNLADVVFQRHDAGFGPALTFARTRGNIATPTIVADGDALGQILAVGFDGTDFAVGGRIFFEVDGTPGTNIMPTRITFQTTPAGSGTSAERMRIDKDGNVGIGTTDPTENLEVATSSGDVTIRIDAEGGVADEAQLDLVSGTTNTKLFYRDSDDSFGIFHKSITRFRIQSDGTILINEGGGNVGIGTIAPNAPVEINGSLPGTVGGFASGIVHVTNDSTAQFAPSVITGHNAFSTNTQLWYLGSTSSSNDNIGFINRQNAAMLFFTNNIERLRIDSTGNVGIGKTPTEELDVLGDAHVSGAIRGGSASGDDLTFESTSDPTKGSIIFQNSLDVTFNAAQFVLKDTNLSLGSGPTNNWNPGDVQYVRVSQTGSVTLTGIVGGTNGRILILTGRSGQTIILANENGDSTDINRIQTTTGSDLTLSGAGGWSVWLIYDAARWMVIRSQ